MHGGAEELTGWIITGFQAQVFVWCWVVFVLLYGVYRSFTQPVPDPIRDSGPVF
jgi:hypothetical protein